MKIFEERLIQADLTPVLDLETTPVFCDQRRIEQILIALIDNAIRYANAGKLTISSQTDGKMWQLKVADNGPGLAEEFQQHLFDPFFRLEQSRNKEFGGTGLGLAVVNAIVIAHKGTVHYENLNSNSIFTIQMGIGSSRE